MTTKPVVTAHATYVIGVWGKCRHYVRNEDGKPAASHNHQPCACPECSKPGKRAWFKCIMTEKWLRESQITKTEEQGG